MLGLLAILVPPIATISVTIVIGAVFFASGVAGLVSTFSGRRAPGFWWSLISAMLGILVGLLLLVQPIAGAVSLDARFDRVLYRRGRFLNLVRRRAPATRIDLGLDGRKRHRRSCTCRHSSDGASRRRRMGARPAGGNDLIFGGAALTVIALRIRTLTAPRREYVDDSAARSGRAEHAARGAPLRARRAAAPGRRRARRLSSGRL